MEKDITISYQGSPLKIATKQRIIPQTDLYVFLHGLGCSKESFDDIWQSPYFASKSLFTYDLPGFGYSAKPPMLTYTLEEQAIIAKLLISTFNPSEIYLIGHNIGGAISILLAEKLAEKLSVVVLLEGNLIAEDCGTFTRQTSTTSLEDFSTTVFLRLKTAFSISTNKGEQLFGKQIDRTNGQAFYKCAQSLLAWSDSGQLLTKFLEMPQKKIYFYGEKSSQWQASGKKLTEQFTKANIASVTVPQAGHFMMNDNPEEFYKLLAQNIVTSNVIAKK